MLVCLCVCTNIHVCICICNPIAFHNFVKCRQIATKTLYVDSRIYLLKKNIHTNETKNCDSNTHQHGIYCWIIHESVLPGIGCRYEQNSMIAV